MSCLLPSHIYAVCFLCCHHFISSYHPPGLGWPCEPSVAACNTHHLTHPTPCMALPAHPTLPASYLLIPSQLPSTSPPFSIVTFCGGQAERTWDRQAAFLSLSITYSSCGGVYTTLHLPLPSRPSPPSFSCLLVSSSLLVGWPSTRQVFGGHLNSNFCSWRTIRARARYWRAANMAVVLFGSLPFFLDDFGDKMTRQD